MIDSVEQYETKVESDDTSIRRSAITESADALTWSAILAKRPDLAADVALNKHLPLSIIDFLLESHCSRVRSIIAMKRSLSNQQFDRLANDVDDSVRIMIANNRKTPLNILHKLQDDLCERVSVAARLQLQIRNDAS